MSSFEEKMTAWFAGRRWRVMTELNGTVTLAGVRYDYDKGAFVISPNGVYVTPFGSRGRKGYVIIEIGEDGQDIPGSCVAFGDAVLRRAGAAVSGLPEGGEE